jgi:hypothetical protein
MALGDDSLGCLILFVPGSGPGRAALITNIQLFRNKPTNQQPTTYVCADRSTASLSKLFISKNDNNSWSLLGVLQTYDCLVARACNTFEMGQSSDRHVQDSSDGYQVSIFQSKGIFIIINRPSCMLLWPETTKLGRCIQFQSTSIRYPSWPNKQFVERCAVHRKKQQ